MENITRGMRRVVRHAAFVGSLSFLVPLMTIGLISLRMDTVSSQSLRPGARAQDPGVRAGTPGAGNAIAGVTDHENEYFLAGKDDFEEADDVAEGLGLALWGAFVIVFIADYILRPKLVGTRMRMNDLLVFIAIFGGVEAFGILGVVVGPIAVALFLSLVRIYQREYRPGGPPQAPDITEPIKIEALQKL